MHSAVCTPALPAVSLPHGQKGPAGGRGGRREKALVEADSANDKKFGAVIEYADADVERLSKKDQN